MGIEVWSLDVTSMESIKETVTKVRELAGGSLDFLVNNAGVGRRSTQFQGDSRTGGADMHAGYQMPLLDSDVDTIKSLFETNVFAVLSVTQGLVPLLIEAKGTIINISSVAGEFALVYSGGYNASKAAMRALSETLRVELMPFDVKVMTVITGIVRTRLFQNMPDNASLPNKLAVHAHQRCCPNCHGWS
jgi:NAD(P)-dependent dehydrogenase (short-subunit alcohol dehydrogenase family)